MGTCYFCHWGWPEPVWKIYDRAVEALGGDDSPLLHSFAHIVWNDENFDSAQWCLDNMENFLNSDYTDEEHQVVKRSLEELLELDPVFLSPPEAYDGHTPQDFLPPMTWGLRKKR